MTVSRVLSEPELVLPTTRATVLKAIEDLGYVPDRGAGSLSTRRTGFIGLVLPTLTNANFSAVAHGLTDALREHGFQLLIAYTDYDLEEEQRQLANLFARRPQAILVTGMAHRRAAARMLMTADVPVIELADLSGMPIQHAVGFSNYKVGQVAAQHLLARGFTRIGAIASREEQGRGDHRGEQRMRGFEDALQAQGHDTGLVLRHGGTPVSFRHGAIAVGMLLDKAPDLEAVFAVSDLSAVGVIMECQRRGLAVPQDLSVIGFGDFEIGRIVNPPLTTIGVDFHQLGMRAGALLLDLLAGENGEEPHIVDVGTMLIERRSVRDAAAERRS
ncbi:LacI family DNA-binding transcriptional regulator [Sphingomonadaceae bacterium OTU29MARTA1]|nr:LacI family DNA-binding transcriptional regulator [Sphingomonadaceae bacterium OTU29MARTA1]